MTTELFNKIQCNYSTTISPKEISSSINDILTNKIKNDIEGKCTTDGYVRKDSIKITRRSPGSIMASHFNGTILYHVNFVADVSNPFEGMILKSKVENVNKMGVIASAGENNFLSILLAKQHHIDNDDFVKIDTGDEIYVSVIGKRFEYGDSQISIIGSLIDKPMKKKTSNTISKVEAADVGAPAAPEIIEDDIEFNNKDRKTKWLGTYNLGKPFKFGGRTFASLEHAITAQKNEDPDFQDLFTKGSDTYVGDLPNIAKKTGNKTNMKKMKKALRANWESLCIDLMKDILQSYYDTNSDLKKKLKSTGKTDLIYRGTGIDTFWGMKQGIEEGNNHFGKLLMELRDTL
jgi:predicted NAD-dependent protein-ADP-ribosyltransferase YbiA (DUF1768 family)/DNA-directed RNA polymerase subunit E'/Rpb7